MNPNTCTTGDLGGDGSCIVLFPGIRKRVKSVTFTVTRLTKTGETYDSGGNHDDDGSSNGTSITVNTPSADPDDPGRGPTRPGSCHGQSHL